MSGFSADWLALREAADARARWPDALAPLRALPSLNRPAAGRPALILDLGSGTGSNCRYLAPRLRGPHDWLLFDHEPALLARATASCGTLPGVASLRTREVDLAAQLHGLPYDDASLLTASALLDLVSADWLTRLAEQCRAAALPALFALSYDGRMALRPHDPDDDLVRAAVNAHQRRDKGFGPALGPAAVATTRAVFAERGYSVSGGRSDWQLDASDAPLQRALIEGWAQAATEQIPDEAARVQRWARRRTALVEDGDSVMIVGHEDLLAIPAPATGR